MMRFLRAWWAQLRRRPIALILTIIFVVGTYAATLAKEWLDEEVLSVLQPWLAARSKLAIQICDFIAAFIAAHWWWLPWCLVPISIISILAWAAFDARASFRRTFVPLEILEDRQLLKQVTLWLSSKLERRDLHIKQAFLFGSVIYDYPTGDDIDIIVSIASTSEKQLAKIGRTLKTTTSEEFKQRFGKPLHITFFSANEDHILSGFLAKLGKYEVLYSNGQSSSLDR